MPKPASEVSSMRFMKPALSLLLSAALFAPYPAAACTSLLIQTSDGSGTYARTMEFAFELKSNALMIPRNYELSGTGADGKPGMKWKSKYAAVGMNALGINALVDGMNEKGLAGGILYFADFAEYADGTKTDPAKSLAPWDFLSWVLTNFASVEEVKAGLKDINVIGVIQSDMGIIPPVHYTIHDASGASLVIEPIDGKLKVYDNPIGVMTNSPPFDWHMTNLRNYVKITAINAPPMTIDSLTFKPIGQGSGWIGIPGDPTPPSRFLRASAYATSVEKLPSGPESVRLAEHIINNFDIPKGWIRNKEEDHVPLEYTQWSTIADLKNLKYYVKMYDDQVLRTIDLNSFDLNGKNLQKTEFSPQLTPPEIKFNK